jgi:hypothetical protein
MNRTCFTCASIVCFALAVFSCSDISNLTTPKSVSVKSSGAAYNVPLGSMSLSDYFTPDKLIEKMSTSSNNIEVYDYNPGGNDTVQEFLINYPITSIPLDFSSYLDNLNLDSSLTKNMTQDFTVSKINDITFTQSVDIPDISGKISGSFNSSVENIPVPEPGDGVTITTAAGTWNGIDVTMNISAPDFDTISFGAGSLNIALTPVGTPTAGFAFNAAGTLKHSSDEISSSGSADLTSGGTLSIPLTGKTIYPNMNVIFTGSLSGGSLGTIDEYKIEVSLSSDVKISQVTGVTMSNSELGNAGTITLNKTQSLDSLADYLVSATVDNGSLTFKGILPSGWTGIESTMTMSITGGLAVDNSNLTDATVLSGDTNDYLINKYLNLNGKIIKPQNIDITSTIQLSLTDADITFPTDGSAQSVTVNGTCSVSSVKDATVKIDKLVDTSALTQSVTQTLPDDVKTYIKSITFKEVKMTGTLSSTLPSSDMNITATVTSTMFNLNKQDTVALSNFSDTLSIVSDYGTEGLTVEPSTNSDVDFTVAVSFSGADTLHTNYVTISGLTFDKTYSLAADFALSYDWSKIVLNTNSTAMTGTMSTGLNLKTLLTDYLGSGNDSLLDNVTFLNISGYLYVKEPTWTGTGESPLKDITMKGKILAKDGTTDINYIIGKDAEPPADMTFIKDMKDFSALADSSKMITTATLFQDGTYSALLNNVSTIINSKPTELNLYYDMIFANGAESTLTLTKEQVTQLTSASGISSISMSVAIVMPLSFKVSGTGITITDALDLAGHKITSDLLNRDSADDLQKIKENIDLVKNITIRYTSTANLHSTIVFADAASSLSKTLNFTGGEKTVSFSQSDIESIFNNYPFEPTVGVTVAPAEEIRIPRDFTMKISISATTDGTYKIWGGED